MEQPEVVTANDDDKKDIAAIMSGDVNQQMQEWNRATIIIVGAGRAGKTGLADSLAGRSFRETTSTVGIEKQSLDMHISYIEAAAATADVKWDSAQKAEHEFEQAIASMVRDKRTGKVKPVIKSKTTKSLTNNSQVVWRCPASILTMSILHHHH